MNGVHMVFDLLERQIVAALRLDPRCPWRKMAAVLGEAEHTVARRGSAWVGEEVFKRVQAFPRRSTGRPEASLLELAGRFYTPALTGDPPALHIVFFPALGVGARGSWLAACVCLEGGSA
ncbi:AsnC family protein [Paenarthrobacter sp. NyZ202]|uniref:AsnC family protein n=1 Tax=Paenarthrobacter sp. NyZ202 TaxID=3402689 RepID=UPI003CF03C45